MKLLLLVLEKLQQKEEVVNSKERGEAYSRNSEAITWILCSNPRANYNTSSFSVLWKKISNHYELIVVHEINLFSYW